jgi:hypothetical protein
MSPRMTREDRERRARCARKGVAHIEFLCEDAIRVTCGHCADPLGWWTNEDSPDWRTDPFVTHDDGYQPGAVALYFRYRGYADTGYEVIVDRTETVRSGPNDIGGTGRIRSTSGRRAANGEQIGKRPWVDNPYPGRRPSSTLTVGQVVVLPARVYCSACGTLNSLPVPVTNEGV